jgi:putative ABC transport system permease protein
VRNYFAVLLRTLARERLYASINIAGLALGIGCSVILGLFLRSELTFDRHHLLHDRIYRVVNEFTINGNTDRFAVTSPMLAPMLAADYPQIKAYVRFQSNAPSDGGGIAIHHGNDTYYWKHSYFVDDDVFEVFTHHIIYGDPKSALQDGSSVAVSETFARKYFGSDNPIGQLISTDSGTPNRITLVFADLPPNTHLKYDLLFSRNSPTLRDTDNPVLRRQALWGVGNYTYLLVAPGFDPQSWARISDEFYKRYMESLARTIHGQWHSWLQPLTATHLQSEVEYDEPNGNRIYLYGCVAVALFILAVACINYTNLATARATRRARSVGIRKILGAGRGLLAVQFLGEALFFALVALVLGTLLVVAVFRLTPINSLMGDEVKLDLLGDPLLLPALLGLGVLIGVVSGAYPALYLSSWAPVSAMTGRYTPGKASLRVREALVLLQFTISAAVIAATLLMFAQMRYVANKSLGFEKENRLVVTLRGATTIEKLTTIRTELAKSSRILGVAEAQIMMGERTPVNVIQIDNNDGVSIASSMAHMPIGEDFVKVMGLRLLQGRDFSRRLLTDIGTNFLVNEAMVRKMGWTEPLGKHISLGPRSGKVIGVVQDFNFKSLHSRIEPFAMWPVSDDFTAVPDALRPFQQRLLVINISGTDVSDTLGYIERVMTQIDPRHPFEFEFLDQQLDNLYKTEHRLMGLIGIFAAVCIFIACLGLFGLAAFTTEQRSREIATRKVLGASAWQIITLLSRPILILVLVAAVLASVLAYLAIDEWLASFAYRAAINPLMFVVAALAAAVVAFATVALQAYKTANSDPVEALREE